MMDPRPAGRAASLIGVLLLLIPSAIALSSIRATFDTDHLVTLSGVITQVEFIEPATYVHMSVRDSEGNSVPWLLQLSPARMLIAQGFKRDSFTKGSHINAEVWTQKQVAEVIADLKDPSRTAAPGREPLAAAWKLTFDDGRILSEASKPDPNGPWAEPALFPSQR